MDFAEVSKYLDDCLIFGIKPSLIRINKILELLGDPHKNTDFIHIVGTNGKTSTALMLADILYRHSISTACHISPHIDSYTERFWINGGHIPEKRFAGIFEEIYPDIERINKMGLGGPITQFEIITAMSFKLAETEDIRVMVSEAGMGGRWDATNAADAILVGFTGVSLEHTDILGDTVEEIGAEKAEVIKNNSGVAVLTGDRRVLEILNKKAKQKNARLFLSGRDFKVARVQNMGLKGWDLDISGIKRDYNNIGLPVLGDYQPLNLSLAVALAELYLDTLGRELDQERLTGGLDDFHIKGRFEILMQQPAVIADAAHNPEGIKNFVKNVNGYFKDRKIIVIFAVLKDKDYRSMIKDVVKVSDKLILTSSLNSRSLGSEDLESETLREMDHFKNKDQLPSDIYRIDNIENSLRFALKISGTNDIICITGSITNLESLGSMVKRLKKGKHG